MERIIVGVDGSPTSTAALCWAMAFALDHGGVVEAWHAWHVTYGAAGAPPDDVAAEQRARATLAAAVAAASGTVPLDPAAVRQVLVRAVPASALLDATRGADLLVLGASSSHRPRLGTVSAQVAAAAQCPVVVIPATS